MKNACRPLPPRCRLPTRSPQFDALAAFGAEVGSFVSKTFLRSRACLGIAGHASTRPMWQFVLRGGAPLFNAAMQAAWGVLVDDAERLAQGASRHADLLLQIGRGGRTAALAADLTQAAGSLVSGAEHAAGALAGVLDCHLMQLLCEKLRAHAPLEIGHLKDLPVLHEASKQVLYYVAGSMRYTLVKYRKLSVDTVKCLFTSASGAAAYIPALPIALCEHREKYGGFSYAKPAFWDAVHAIDRVYTKFCCSGAIATFGKDVVALVSAAAVAHSDIQALFATAAALCIPAITGPELAQAVVTTLSFSRQKELVASVRSELGLQADKEQALRASLKVAKSKRKDKRMETKRSREAQQMAGVEKAATKSARLAPGIIRNRARAKVSAGAEGRKQKEREWAAKQVAELAAKQPAGAVAPAGGRGKGKGTSRVPRKRKQAQAPAAGADEYRKSYNVRKSKK